MQRLTKMLTSDRRINGQHHCLVKLGARLRNFTAKHQYPCIIGQYNCEAQLEYQIYTVMSL